MKLCLINHDYRYELEKIIRLFLPFEKIEFLENEKAFDNAVIATLSDDSKTAFIELYFLEKEYKASSDVDVSAFDLKKEIELKFATILYNCLCEATNYESQWGILTGIRPAKLYSRIGKEIGKENTDEHFKKVFLVSDNKLSLCKAANISEQQIISLSRDDSFSLYISIPFCPSRCSYCSFVSHSVEAAHKLIPEYVRLLCEEIKQTAKIAKALKLRLETVYIGGGTPTSISAEQLFFIMTAIKDNFDLSNLREYTVEAGRPDTVTEEKLTVIKRMGATRISINPQTMNDSVLEAIGRRHTEKQTADAFCLARELGFDNINMDLIAGLPTDTFEGFKETLNKVLKLNPESVTIHALSLKRSSTMTKLGELPEIEVGREAALMVDYGRNTLEKAGIMPYYMYRQSKTVGNLENVGYAKKGYECLYNVYIMDETHTILACGASAVTKLKEPRGSYIERIFNYKYPYEYINKFDEMLNRKNGISEFYAKYGKQED